MSAARLRTLATVAVSVALVAPARAAAGQPPTTVVVAPFTNLSRQPADDWIGAGIAETIAADLRSAGLTVIGHGLVERMRTGNGNRNGNGERGTPEPDAALEAYRQRGVTWLVDGTLQRVADQLRITTRVVDVASGGVGFSTRVDGALSDLFDLQDEIAAALATRLSTAAGESEARPERNVTGALTFGGAGGGGAAPRRDTTRNAPGGGGFAPTRQDRPMVTVGRTTTPPQIDGRLDDAVWETATHITDFIQIAPVEGAPGSEATEVWIAYDGDYLYFAFYAHYARPEIMRVNRADREEIRGDDRMSVLFDPFLDQQRAYQLEVNGYGVQGDSLVNADGSTGFSRSSASSSVTRGNSGSRRRGGSGMTLSGQFGIRGDQSWNALFDTGGQIVADGWTAEMRIPFKSLRYPSRAPGQEHRWGFQITRIIRDKSEAQTWAPISRGVAGQLTQFGVLTGMSDLSRSRNLEFLPELTGLRFGALDTETGAFATGDPLGDLGVGVKYGLTPNLTADITFNPDFSQIESDRPQIETNQRFDLFYPEQRPFFLEGQEIFQTSTPLTLVHTRTIVDPRFGGKLTGKVGRTTLGVVVADDEAAGRLDDAAHPQYGASAQTVLGRARYDFYAESYLGAIMTAREFGEDYNRVAGVDGRFRLDRTHRVSFLAVRAETRDGTRSFSGPAFEVDFSKQGRNLSYNVAHSSIDPDFATSTGFLPRDDLRQTSGTVSYRWWPESTLMTWGPSVTYLRLYDHAGVLQDEQLQSITSFSFRNNMAIFGMVNRDLERYGEVAFRKTGYGFFGVVSARTLSVYGGYNWGDGILYSNSPYLGRSTLGNVNVRFQPTSRLRTELTMISSDFTDPVDGAGVFNVKIFRTRTTYQFTERLLLRHIAEHNTQSVTVGNNVLFTYRINAGTVVFLGYDDRYQRGTRIDSLLFPTTALQRTNRAVFGKISYLFRY